MNKAIEKNESRKLDLIVVIRNLEYLRDNLVVVEKKNNRKKVKVEEDLDKTIIICNSDYEDWKKITLSTSLLWLYLTLIKLT